MVLMGLRVRNGRRRVFQRDDPTGWYHFKGLAPENAGLTPKRL